jgi:predicted ATP-grasp superfamily ATP-dependent carboligase
MTESADEAHVAVTGIDFFGDLDCRGKMLLPQGGGAESGSRGLLETARGLGARPLVYGAGIENHGQALQYWEERELLLGNGSKALAQARNPFRLRESLGRTGLRMPEFFGADRMPPAGEWLLKPLFRGGGHGICRLPEDTAELRRVLSRLEAPERYIVQAFQKGLPASMTFLANGSSALPLGASYQLNAEDKGINSFYYTGSIVPLKPAHPAFWEDMARAAARLTEDFGLVGLNTLDFMLCGDTVLVLELNPRWSASVELIEAWIGRRLFADHMKACQGALPEWAKREDEFASRQFYGKRILYAGEGIIVGDYREGWGPLYNGGVRDLPRPGVLIKQGEPLCTVLAEGATKEECSRRLAEKAARMQAFYLQGRMNKREEAHR